MQSKTKSGFAVTLTPEEYCGSPEVRVQVDHPSGKINFTSAVYGPAPGGEGIIGHIRSGKCCITVPKADFDAVMNEAKAIGEREVEAIKSGSQLISLHYDNGSTLSGFAVHGRAVALLVELGLAKPVQGWGYLVGNEVVKALGETFSYAQAVEYTRPVREQKAVREEAKAQVRAEKFDLARATGQPVELSSWNDDCCEKNFDCDFDLVTEYALPDGTTRVERHHTH